MLVAQAPSKWRDEYERPHQADHSMRHSQLKESPCEHVGLIMQPGVDICLTFFLPCDGA